MNERKKYLFGFFAICIAFAISMQITVFLIAFAHMQRLSRALPIESILGFVTLYWWIQRSRGRMPKRTLIESMKLARNLRNLGMFFIAAPALGYLTRGSELLALPYWLGFILPIIPLSFAIHYLRLSARLHKAARAEGIAGQEP